MDNPFYVMAEKYGDDAETLVAAFVASHEHDELMACLRFARRTTGSIASDYLQGCLFADFDVESDFDVLRDMAWDYLESKRPSYEGKVSP